MLSPSLVQLLDRARSRFGLEVEILDAGLENLYPSTGTDLARMIEASPSLRTSLLGALAAGRTQDLEDSGTRYRVYPLRPGRRPNLARLVAVKQSSPSVRPLEATSWTELTRAVVEADLATLDTLGDERERARRLFGMLRLLEFISRAEDPTEVGEALIQAFGVWYDVDARLYSRTLDDRFALRASLPGVVPDERSRRLPASILEPVSDLVRTGSLSDFGDVLAREAVLVPCGSRADARWLVVLLGSVPSEADSLLPIIGRFAGSRLETLRGRASAGVRQRVEHVIAESARAPELVALRALQELVQSTQAAAGVLTLIRQGTTRRIAAVGRPASDQLSGPTLEPLWSPERLVCPMPLSGPDGAVLELYAEAGGEFDADGVALVTECASLVRSWLAGSLMSMESSAFHERSALAASGFSARIQEELDRARRFDLRLSLILIDVNAPSDTVALLRDTLRRELRGSDVTGTMSGSHVAALLTHTDAAGLDNAVRRIRHRLADMAGQLDVAHIRLGQAALSPECRTVNALLDLALEHAEPVIVH